MLYSLRGGCSDVSVMLDEKRLGAGVRPTFHNHPEERVIANVDHINAHHVYRHNNDAEEQTQQTARTTNDQSTVRKRETTFYLYHGQKIPQGFCAFD